MKHSDTIIRFLDENFNEKKCSDLCRRSGFIKRSSSKLKGHEFIKAMILPSEGLSKDSLKGLCKRIKEFNPEADLSAQALCERINSEVSVRLMKEVLGGLLKIVHSRITTSCPKLAAGLPGFNKVLVQDSTVASLNARLEKEYEGSRRGNNRVSSQIKIDTIYDLGKGLLIDAEMFDGNEPDQNLARRIIEFVDVDDLVIRDLGYFAMSAFLDIVGKGAYFLSRMKPRVHFYLNITDELPLDLEKYLKLKSNQHKSVLGIRGYLGKEKVPIRLIVYRQSEEVTSQRLRAAHKHARKQGETMSESKKFLLHYSVFVTNAPEEKLSAEMVGTIYRVRWEAELVFKRWKSQLQIDYLQGISKHRIECLVLSRLCTVVILDLVAAFLKNIVNELCETELSEVKFIQYMMRGSAFCTAIAQNKLERFFNDLGESIPRMLVKDKRHRKTMRERVLTRESYCSIQGVDNEHVA